MPDSTRLTPEFVNVRAFRPPVDRSVDTVSVDPRPIWTTPVFLASVSPFRTPRLAMYFVKFVEVGSISGKPEPIVAMGAALAVIVMSVPDSDKRMPWPPTIPFRVAAEPALPEVATIEEPVPMDSTLESAPPLEL